MSVGQVVDTATAQEFMAQALEKVERAELGDIVAALEQKSARFQSWLAPERLPVLERAELRALLRAVFATRRKADTLIEVVSEDGLRKAMAELLFGTHGMPERFQCFVDSLSGYMGDARLTPKVLPGKETENLPENVLCDLASELLHFSQPDTYWLWSRWMWDPRTGTGALPLVTMEEYDLRAQNAGETYAKMGRAVAFVQATGEAAGFARFGVNRSPFGIDVFLACVYAVYMYTTLRIRMTQEFTKVVPQLPELTRRLLGVWRIDDC